MPTTPQSAQAGSDRAQDRSGTLAASRCPKRSGGHRSSSTGGRCGGEYVWYHPLADGRVLVSTRVLRLTAEQAETLAEGKHPDVEVLTMASGAGVFRWTDYLRNVIGLPDSAPA